MQQPNRSSSKWEWTLELGQLIHEYARIQAVVTDRLLLPMGVTRAQGFILVYLSWHPGATPSDLAILYEVSRVATGGLVRRLIERGMIEALSDPKDKRVIRLVLTHEGRKVVAQFSAAGQEINRLVMAGLSEAKGRELINLFKTMKERMAKVTAIDYPESPAPTGARRSAKKSSRKTSPKKEGKKSGRLAKTPPSSADGLGR